MQYTRDDISDLLLKFRLFAFLDPSMGGNSGQVSEIKRAIDFLREYGAEHARFYDVFEAVPELQNMPSDFKDKCDFFQEEERILDNDLERNDHLIPEDTKEWEGVIRERLSVKIPQAFGYPNGHPEKGRFWGRSSEGTRKVYANLSPEEAGIDIKEREEEAIKDNWKKPHLSEKDRAEILGRVYSKMRVGKGICSVLGEELREQGIFSDPLDSLSFFPEIKEHEPSPEYRYNDAFWFSLDETGNRKRLYILDAAIKKIEGTYGVEEEIGKIEESLNKLKRLLLIPFLLVPLSLFSQHDINREVRMASNIDDLILQWGYPVDRVNRDGVTECTWYYVNGEMKSYPSWGDRWCTVKVTFRDKQKVDWTWEGNDCR